MGVKKSIPQVCFSILSCLTRSKGEEIAKIEKVKWVDCSLKWFCTVALALDKCELVSASSHIHLWDGMGFFSTCPMVNDPQNTTTTTTFFNFASGEIFPILPFLSSHVTGHSVSFLENCKHHWLTKSFMTFVTQSFVEFQGSENKITDTTILKCTLFFWWPVFERIIIHYLFPMHALRVKIFHYICGRSI